MKSTTTITAWWKALTNILFTSQHNISHPQRWLASLGGLSGLLLILLLNQYLLQDDSHVFMIASMGASAVLIFAVPDGYMSQPWPVLGGHVCSVLVGMIVAATVNTPILACAVAVALSITLMHYLHCLHPPGGATALVAVVGGPAIQQLEHGTLLFIITLNALTLITLGQLFNRLIR